MYNQNYDYLEHHGILGQRWGIRRYQNKDGSLTPAGAKRAAKLEKKLSKLKGETKTSTSGESVSSEDHKKYVESSGKKMSEMSTRELNEFANRYVAMQRYSETQAKIKESKKTTGQKLKDKVIKSAKQAGEEYLNKMVKQTVNSALDKAFGTITSNIAAEKSSNKQTPINPEIKKEAPKTFQKKEAPKTEKKKNTKSKSYKATTDFVDKYYYTPYTPLLGIEDKKNK